MLRLSGQLAAIIMTMQNPFFLRANPHSSSDVELKSKTHQPTRNSIKATAKRDRKNTGSGVIKAKRAAAKRANKKR